MCIKKIICFSFIIVVTLLLSGCGFKKNKFLYDGKYMEVYFNVNDNYVLSLEEKYFNNFESGILIGDKFDIGIVENKDLFLDIYNGDFSSYMDLYKDNSYFKEVKYSSLDGFSYYSKNDKKYIVYLPLKNKYILQLNVYSKGDNMEKIIKSRELRRVLKNIIIYEK